MNYHFKQHRLKFFLLAVFAMFFGALFAPYFQQEEPAQAATATSAGVTNVAPSFTVSPAEKWTNSVADTWFAQTSPISNILRDVHFATTNTGWAVSANAEIIKTTNGGDSWTSSSVTGQFWDIFCLDINDCWVVGNAGKIVNTIDGGSSWPAQTSNTSNDIRSVHFSDSTNGWAVGVGTDDGVLSTSNIRTTSDGGSTWTAQTSTTANTLYGVRFADSQKGWAVGAGGTILRTVNGGSTWSAQSSGTSNLLFAVYFDADASCQSDVSTCEGWAVGASGTIRYTTDGGTTWTGQTGAPNQTLLDVHFVDANNGWVVGGLGSIASTTNGGTTWTDESTGSSTLWGLHAFDVNNIWAVGENSSILKSGFQTNSSPANPTNDGSILYFNATAFDDNADNYYLIICKNSATPTPGAPPECNGGAANRWGTGSEGYSSSTASGSEATVTYTTGTVDETGCTGGNNESCVWYGFVCDTTNCSSSDQGSGNSGSPFVVNHRTVISNISEVEVSDTSDATPEPGERLQFQFLLSDSDKDDVTGVVCDTTFNDTTRTCNSEELCRTGLTWSSQTSGTSNVLYGSHFIDENNGWAVGQSGTIRNTTDGGVNWGGQTSGTTNQLNAVHFIDENTGWAVGDDDGIGGDAVILKTINGGSSWSTQTSGTTQDIEGVDFIDANNGWAAGLGGTILNTSNGGTGWGVQTTPTSNNLFALDFIDVNNGWAAGVGGTILNTTDGGTNWSTQTSGTSNLLQGVYFIDVNTGWAVGQIGTIVKTVDGGTNWSTQTSGTSNNLFDVYFADANIGWAVGFNGTVLTTIDGGTTWSAETSGTSNRLRSVHFTDANTGWAVGDSGAIIKGLDGVNPVSVWSSQAASANLFDVHFTDKNTGWVVGVSSTIEKTTDGGLSWTAQTSPVSVTFGGLYMVDANNGWVVGNSGKIVNTTDGGTTWTEQTSGTSVIFREVYCIDTSTCWAVGDVGLLRKTTDGGATAWSDPSGAVLTSNTILNVYFIDKDTGWIVALSGVIQKTTDGGANWSTQTSNTSENLSGLHFIDKDTGWVSGGNGVILKTTDGGANWSSKTSGTSELLNEIHFIDENTGWAFSQNGTILYSDDGGDSWTSQTSGTTNALYNASFVDKAHVWLATAPSAVLTGKGLSYCNETDTVAADLYIKTPTPHGNKAYTLHAFDEHNFVDGGGAESQNIDVEDTDPYVMDSSAYTASSPITLTAGATQAYNFTVTIKDDNGDTDITGASGAFYDGDEVELTTGSCTDDDNDCYTDSSCTLSNNTSGADNTATAQCDFTLKFNANAGTNWLAHVNPSDGVASNDETDSDAITINPLAGLTAVESTINYGALAINGTSAGQTISIGNVGNQSNDILVEGANMTCTTSGTCGVSTIPLAKQKWHESSSTFTYGDTATGDGPYPLVSTASATTGANGCVNHDLRARDDYLSITETNLDLFWRLQIPAVQPSGSYAGTLTLSTTNSCTAEICDNEIDDDGDGRIDCSDKHDCDLNPTCTVVTMPMRGVDHDTGNNRTLDLSDNLFHATFGDGVTSSTFPTKLIKPGYNFDGIDDYLSIPDAAGNNFGTGDFTIAFWFRRDDTGSGQTLMAKRSAVTDDNAGWLIGTGATLTDDIFIKIGDGVDDYTLPSSSQITDTLFHHFIASVNKSLIVDVYIDGVNVNGTETGTLSLVGNISNVDNLIIGDNSGLTAPFNGKITDVKIFDSAFIPAQAKNLYLEQFKRFK